MLEEKYGVTGLQYQIGTAYEACNCCGLRVRTKDSKLDLFRSNYINVIAGKRNNRVTADGKREVITIESKNGPITLGMRYEW